MTKIYYHTTQSKLHLADMSKIHPTKPHMVYCVQCKAFVKKDKFNTDCPKGK